MEAVRRRALEDCATLLDLVLRGRIAAEEDGTTERALSLAIEAFRFTMAMEPFQTGSVMFELVDQLIDELAEKHGGLQGLAAAIMKDEPVFARERSVADEESTEADHGH